MRDTTPKMIQVCLRDRDTSVSLVTVDPDSLGWAQCVYEDWGDASRVYDRAYETVERVLEHGVKSGVLGISESLKLSLAWADVPVEIEDRRSLWGYRKGGSLGEGI